jgi:hypothetical protein
VKYDVSDAFADTDFCEILIIERQRLTRCFRKRLVWFRESIDPLLWGIEKEEQRASIVPTCHTSPR